MDNRRNLFKKAAGIAVGVVGITKGVEGIEKKEGKDYPHPRYSPPYGTRAVLFISERKLEELREHNKPLWNLYTNNGRLCTCISSCSSSSCSSKR